MIIYISSEYAKYLLLKIHILRPPLFYTKINIQTFLLFVMIYDMNTIRILVNG